MNQTEFEAIANEFGVEHPFEVARKYGISRCELLMRMGIRNNKVFEEWLADYARRCGRPIDEVRKEVLEQRRLTAEHCNSVYRRELGIAKSDGYEFRATESGIADMMARHGLAAE